MKRFNYILALLGFAALANSCSDYLDVDPYGSSTIDSYYKTDADVTLALTAAYDFIHSDQFSGWSSPEFVKALPGDDTNCGGGGTSDQPQYQAIDVFNWSSENTGITDFYRLNYFGIYRCNLIINNVVDDSPLKHRMIGEAKFLRAFFYFDLTMTFGNVPLRLKVPTGIDDQLAASTQAEIYAQIEKDLTDAISVLPNKSGYTGGDKFRANKQAAQALLGKTYLYAKDYPNAVKAFEQVIATEGTEVGLEANFADVHKKISEFGKESLLEVSFISEDKNWGNAQWNRVAADNRHIILEGPRSPWDGGTSGILAGWGFNPPTKKLYNEFESSDSRRLHTVISTAELKSVYNGSFTDGWETEGMIRTKLTTFASETTSENGAVPELNYATNWRLIRYADVLLMAAEAYHFSGNDTKAIECINKVRTRAGVALIDATGTPGVKQYNSDPIFSSIVHERMVELAYESFRFWDLVRWGIADKELEHLSNGASFVKGKHEHFPIPLTELSSNKLMKQNPGY